MVKTLANIRRDYGDLQLLEAEALADPILQFQRWFDEILITNIGDPNAMVLSTVDAKGDPDSRVVLLKGVDESGAFVFYTNYKSHKAEQIAHHAVVALNFYWPTMARQVRIRGEVVPTSASQSDEYFASRPLNSQWGAIASPQSTVIASREVLDTALEKLQKENQIPVKRPDHWGGYRVIPHEIEFWQGRDNRLHDRIFYNRKEESWHHYRLAP